MMKLKIIKISLILITILLSGCTSSPYYLVSNVESINHSGKLSGQMEANHSHNGGNNMPATYTQRTIANGLKPVYFPEEELENLGMSNGRSFMRRCVSKEYTEALKLIEQNQLSDSSKSFLKAIVFLLQKQYKKSLTELDNLYIESLEGSIELLRLDNIVEIQKRGSEFPNYKSEALKSYQTLFDSGTLNKTEEKILKNRVKHLNYA